MATINTNISFIKELLALDEITSAQQSAILELFANEITKIEKSQEGESDSKINFLNHSPVKVIQTLKKFTYDQRLKWTVHLWDGGIKYKTYLEFIEDLDMKTDSSISLRKEFYDLRSYNSTIQQIIYSFVFQDKLHQDKVTKRDIPYGWGRDNIKVGWRWPNGLMEEWADNEGNWSQQKKSPFTMNLLGEHVQKITSKNQSVEEGNELRTFNAVVSQFKKEIEFRGSAFYRMIKKKLEILNNIFPKDKLPTDRELKTIFYNNHEFFASTWQFELALDRIFHNLLNRPTANNYPIEFYSRNVTHEENNYKIIEILHKGSFSGATYDGNLKLQGKGGDIQALIQTLTSVCDFSIESKFYLTNESELLSYRIEYLYDDVGQVDDKYEAKTPILLDEPALGFKYIFKFPL